MGMIHMHEKIHNEMRRILILMKKKNELGRTFSDTIQYLINNCNHDLIRELKNISDEEVKELKDKMCLNKK